MRIIKLTHGCGNGVDTACLMTASNMLIGRGTDGDKNDCVCPLLRKFIIQTNDAMPEEMLGRLYTPLIWEILGTKNDAVIVDRALLFADWACRIVLPLVIPGFEVSPIINPSSAKAAAASAYAAATSAYAAATAHAAHAAHAFVDTVACDAHVHAASSAYASASAAYASASAAADANAVAYAVAYAARVAKYAKAWELCPDIIRRVAAVGEKQKVTFAITVDELAEMLEGNT